MRDDPKYVRVYYSVVNDDRFAEIYHDARRFGAWLQLLLVADAMYPADAPIPAYIHRPSLKALTDAGLVELCAHQHYRMHGLASERGKRSQSARNAAVLRWQSARNADPMPSRAEQRQDEQSIRAGDADASPRDDARPDVEAFLGTRFRVPTPGQRTFMDAYCQVFDQTGPERAARLIWGHPDDPIGALKEDLAAFREERRVEALASEAPKPRRTKGSGMSKVSDELAKLYLAPNNGSDAVPLAELVTPEALAAAGRKP
jgi:hypothetical protein